MEIFSDPMGHHSYPVEDIDFKARMAALDATQQMRLEEAKKRPDLWNAAEGYPPLDKDLEAQFEASYRKLLEDASPARLSA